MRTYLQMRVSCVNPPPPPLLLGQRKLVTLASSSRTQVRLVLALDEWYINGTNSVLSLRANPRQELLALSRQEHVDPVEDE